MTNQAVLPEAIRRQVEEAEALERELYGESTPETGNTDPETPPVEPAETPEPVAVAPAEQPAPPAPKDDEETYQQRYRVLQAKYDAEVPRLHAQVREANAQIQTVLAEIAQIKAAPPPVAPEPAKPDNDAEVFGEDLIEAVDRRAEAKARKLVDEQLLQMRQYIAKLEEQLGTVNQQVTVSSQDRFLSQLAARVPDYESLNTDQGFLAWLAEADPVYGIQRQVALNAAAENLDAERAANIFSAYKTLTGKQVATAQQQQARQELERQVAPSASRVASQQAPTGKIWTAAEYEKALDPRNIAKMGRAEADRVFAEAEAAYNEGRVRF